MRAGGEKSFLMGAFSILLESLRAAAAWYFEHTTSEKRMGDKLISNFYCVDIDFAGNKQ